MHQPEPNIQPDYAALILAGGRGSRMGGVDKGLVKWGGQPLVQAVLTRLQSQTILPQSTWISANRNEQQYTKLGAVAVIRDDRPGYAGPLSGIESTLLQVNVPLLLVVPCDTPLLPVDLFESLFKPIQRDASILATYATTPAHESTLTARMNESSKTDIEISAQAHPLCCLLRTTLLDDLTTHLNQGQQRVMAWMQDIQAKAVTFKDSAAFTNVNDPKTLASLRSAP